jgi:hypothetical protein
VETFARELVEAGILARREPPSKSAFLEDIEEVEGVEQVEDVDMAGEPSDVEPQSPIETPANKNKKGKSRQVQMDPPSASARSSLSKSVKKVGNPKRKHHQVDESGGLETEVVTPKPGRKSVPKIEVDLGDRTFTEGEEISLADVPGLKDKVCSASESSSFSWLTSLIALRSLLRGEPRDAVYSALAGSFRAEEVGDYLPMLRKGEGKVFLRQRVRGDCQGAEDQKVIGPVGSFGRRSFQEAEYRYPSTVVSDGEVELRGFSGYRQSFGDSSG